jgi:CheY-like chemotaxis protein
MSTVARILISEPTIDVRQLFEHMVRRLGHEPLALWSLTAENVQTVDVLLVETADEGCAELAAAARRLRPSLPIVAVSILPPHPGLTLEPDAHLLKPFALTELRAAIAGVLPG